MMRNPLKTWLTLVVIASAYGAATVHSSDFATLRRNAFLLNRGSVKCYRTTTPRRASKKPTASTHVAPAPVKPVREVCSALEEYGRVIDEIGKSVDPLGMIGDLQRSFRKLGAVLNKHSQGTQANKISALTTKFVEHLFRARPGAGSSPGNEQWRKSLEELDKYINRSRRKCENLPPGPELPPEVCSALEEYGRVIDEISKSVDPLGMIGDLQRSFRKLGAVLNKHSEGKQANKISALTTKFVEHLFRPRPGAGSRPGNEPWRKSLGELDKYVNESRKKCESQPTRPELPPEVCSALEEYGRVIDEIGKSVDPLGMIGDLQRSFRKLGAVLNKHSQGTQANKIGALTSKFVEHLFRPRPGAGSSPGNEPWKKSLEELAKYLEESKRSCTTMTRSASAGCKIPLVNSSMVGQTSGRNSLVPWLFAHRRYTGNPVTLQLST